MKNYRIRMVGELLILFVLFQFLPNKNGGCGVGCHPGNNYGSPCNYALAFLVPVITACYWKGKKKHAEQKAKI